MADHAAVPDYELAETLALTEPAHYRALFEDTRLEIAGLLLERAATTSELASVLSKPKGTVGHHLKVMEDAGLVKVVRTKRVRALEAKYYGRTARVFLYNTVAEAADIHQQVLARAAAEIAAVPAATALPVIGNVRYARIPAERAEEWSRRVQDLLVEFAEQPRSGETTFGLVVGLYPTSRPPLPDQENQ
jgi:DNA-binding transcriptional ArsR family regulator